MYFRNLSFTIGFFLYLLILGPLAPLCTEAADKTDLEFQVNTYTDNGQIYPSVAALSGGGFVVTWQSYEQDGSDTGIYGQLFEIYPGNSPPSIPDATLDIGGDDDPNSITTLDPLIEWGYADSDGDSLISSEVEVWTDLPFGIQVWNTTISGSGTSVSYAGSTLISGKSYYLRVRVYDGKCWSAWKEMAFSIDVEQEYGIKLQNFLAKEKFEDSFSIYDPSKVVGIVSGNYIRFYGRVTDLNGNPLADKTVVAFDPTKYDPENDQNGKVEIATDSGGYFYYPESENELKMDKAGGVYSFWFKASGKSAIPFMLFLYDESVSVGSLQGYLDTWVTQNSSDVGIDKITINTDSTDPISKLDIDFYSYPPQAADLSSSDNDRFFACLAVSYVGPTDEPFLLSKEDSETDYSSGWLYRGVAVYREKVTAYVSSMPENMEDYFYLLENATTSIMDYDPFKSKWNMGLYALEGILCVGDLVTMDPGYGYWINTKEAYTWTLP